jgi:predicted TIM-barrel fold metal-dependent hydrolase
LADVPSVHSWSTPIRGYDERPEWESVVAARDRLLQRHARLRFIGIGLLGHADDLDMVARCLDAFPNLAVSIDRVLPVLMSDHPADAVREFVLCYQERLLYASAGPANEEHRLASWAGVHGITYRYLSTSDTLSMDGRRVRGLGLPEEAVHRIFRENALRWIPDLVSRGGAPRTLDPPAASRRGPDAARVTRWLAQMPKTLRETWSIGRGGAIPLPTFTRIDAHVHVFTEWVDYYAMIERSDVRALNIGIVQDTMTDEEQDTQRAAMVSAERATIGRIRWIVGLDPYGWEEPAWPEREIARIDSAFDEGAIGVKIAKNVGMTVTGASARFLLPSDHCLDPVLDHIARAGRTLYLHVSDPIEAWRRLDPSTPHFQAFQQHPSLAPYRMYEHVERPSREAIIDARDELLARHPDLRVIGCHLGQQAHELHGLARRLDRYPNFALDTSTALHQLMTYQSQSTIREFFITYSDRLLYGTDAGLHAGDDPAQRTRWLEEQYARDWKWFSTTGVVTLTAARADGDDIHVWDREVEGLDLPQVVLTRLYYANARRWVPGL